MHNSNQTYNLSELLERFIKDSRSGKRIQKNGKRLRIGSVQNYIFLKKLLIKFSEARNFELRIKSLKQIKKRDFAYEKKYWKTFYLLFTDYLYNDLNCFDNYVGNNIKLLRVFFNYLNEERGLEVGSFHKMFHVCKEEIQIIPLLPEQLNFLIYNKEFEEGLNESLRKTKDIFVFGCTVGLRVSDLLNLTTANLEIVNGNHYLKVLSKKSERFSRILLPDYAVKIIYKNKRRKSLFTPIHYSHLDKNIKLLIEAAGWTHLFIKTRSKRGIPIIVYKNEKTKENYRFCDLLSSHTMRRTAITTMLCLGMPEHAVRKISGHSANSKEFFRYVELSQSFLDAETEKIFQKLQGKKLIQAV